MKSYLALTADEQTVYNQDVESLEPEEKRQIVVLKDMFTSDALRRKGIQMALRLLEHRFGQLSPGLRDAVEQLSDDSLDDLALAVMDFATVADAESWIAHRR